MSFYCYLSAAGCWVVAADNKKHVVTVKTTLEGRTRMEELTTGDAHKIYPLGAGWWMTGVGLSVFLHQVREHVQKALETARVDAGAAIEVIGRLVENPRWVRRMYHRWIEAFREDLPAESVRPEVLGSLQEVVFVGFDATAQPVVLRARSDAGFDFLRRSGPGIRGFAGEKSTWDAALEEKIRLFLADAAEELQDRAPSQIGDRAWDIIPPLFQRLARAFPQKLSAHGDLVCISPQGHQWFLF